MARNADSPVTYLLRDPKAKTPTPINCVLRFDNQRINIGTGFKVMPSHWNLQKQDARDELFNYIDRGARAWVL